MTTATVLPAEHVYATVQVERSLTVEFIASVLSTALEGGIGYWSYAEQIEREDVPTEVDSIGWRYKSYVLDIGTDNIGESTEFPAEVQLAGDPFRAQVTCDTAVSGIQRILSGKPETLHLYGGNIAIVAQAVAENDAGEIDSSAADWIVQVGLFGEVIYG